ncbi:GntR family transcriptional regulator [Streptacidiphilus sp. N1-10]|uniref:GntR family transcriptional regulator n=1 Tax=Streptacidiphilus jeojiensis TaxID=3229225 RepID=A0ABV6XEQ2_9ACTN
MRTQRPAAGWVRRLAADRPGTVHEVILDELRAVILAGHAPPGAPMNIDAIAHRFTVSRIPVREALKTLIGEGLVDHAPRAGYAVAQVTRAELAELYVVREALEAAALSAAAQAATEDDDAEVAKAHEALSQAIEDHDARGHHRESRRFHLALAGPCRMRRLLGMFESAWNITEPLQPMSHVSREMTLALHTDHQLMVDAFHARDADALLAVSAVHYRRLQDVVAALPVNGLRP